MYAGSTKEMIVGEIDAEQTDAPRAHVNRETERYVRRVLRVVQHVRIGEVRAALRTKREFDDVTIRQSELELCEDKLRLRSLDIAKPIAGKLVAWIHHHEIVRLKLPPDVVHANRDEPLGMLELIQRMATPANDHRLALMNVRK